MTVYDFIDCLQFDWRELQTTQKVKLFLLTVIGWFILLFIAYLTSGSKVISDLMAYEDGTYITGNAAGTATGKRKLSGDAIIFISDIEKDGVASTKKVPFKHLSDDSLVLLLNNDQTSIKLKLVLLSVE